jgi:hypothetical protein
VQKINEGLQAQETRREAEAVEEERMGMASICLIPAGVVSFIRGRW